MFEYINLSNPETIIIICCLILIFYFYITPSIFSSSNENFSKYDEDTDQIYGMINGMIDSPVKFLSPKEFNYMVSQIKIIIFYDIMNYAKVCADMNGSDGPESNQMTIQCAEPTAIKSEITNHVAEYIINTIRQKFNINLNPYQVVGDFMNNLDLIRDIIDPLLNTNIYTVHGIQYFDKNMLNNIIYSYQDIQDVLYTTLQKRGIDVNQLDEN